MINKAEYGPNMYMVMGSAIVTLILMLLMYMYLIIVTICTYLL